MKKYKLFIVLSATFLTFFNFNVFGQTTKEQDVNDFFASFVKEMNQIGDIDKMPEKYFSSNFKTHFTQNDEWIIGVSEYDSKLFDKLTDSEKYQYSISISNFIYLLIQCYFDQKGTMEGWDDDKKLLEGLPKNIVSLLKTSKWLQAIFDDENKISEARTLQELTERIIELDSISVQMRKFLSNRSPSQKRKYDQIWTKNRKQQILDDSNTSSDICEGESCMGLPEKTRIHALHAFNFCLRIAKVNNEYKIINIYCGFCED